MPPPGWLLDLPPCPECLRIGQPLPVRPRCAAGSCSVLLRRAALLPVSPCPWSLRLDSQQMEDAPPQLRPACCVTLGGLLAFSGPGIIWNQTDRVHCSTQGVGMGGGGADSCQAGAVPAPRGVPGAQLCHLQSMVVIRAPALWARPDGAVMVNGQASSAHTTLTESTGPPRHLLKPCSSRRGLGRQLGEGDAGAKWSGPVHPPHAWPPSPAATCQALP